MTIKRKILTEVDVSYFFLREIGKITVYEKTEFSKRMDVIPIQFFDDEEDAQALVDKLNAEKLHPNK